MPPQDFLIRFGTDVGPAMRALDQLARKATEVEQRLNSLGVKGSRGGAAGAAGGQNILRSVGADPASVQASERSLARLQARLETLQRTRAATDRLGETTPGQLRQEAIIEQRIAALQGEKTSLRAQSRQSESQILRGLQDQTRQLERQIVAADRLAASRLRQESLGQTISRSSLNREALLSAEISQNPRVGTGMQQLYRERATALQGRANEMGNARIIEQENRALQNQIALVERLANKRADRARLGETTSAGQLRTEALALQNLSRATGLSADQKARYTLQAQRLAAQARLTASAVDHSSGAFDRHARRIAEGIIIYEALGRTMQAIGASINIIVDVDRESRRLAAALEMTDSASQGFIDNIGEIASRTVTPFGDMVAEADTAAAAFRDIADPIERAANAEQLLNLAGGITSVTQRDLATVITNLIAIMKQTDTPMGEFGDLLGQIVVAGGNTSAGVKDLLDALQQMAGSAQAVGIEFNDLLALTTLFTLETGRSGTQVGNTFRTLFQTMTSPAAEEKLTELTDGAIRLRDSSGALRPFLTIMKEVKDLFEGGIITKAEREEIERTLAPELNPGAATDVKRIIDLLDQIPGLAERIGAADVSNLNTLVGQLNNALGARFQRLMIDAERYMVRAFSGPVEGAGQDLLDFLENLFRLFQLIPPEVIITIGQLIALGIAMRGVVLIGRQLGIVLGIGGLITSLRGMSTAAAAAGTQMKLSELAAAGWLRVVSRLLPILLAISVIDFAGGKMEDAERISALRDDFGFTEEQAQNAINPERAPDAVPAHVASRLSPEEFARLHPGQDPYADTFTTPGNANYSEIEAENIKNLADAWRGLDESQREATGTRERMEAAIRNTDGSLKDERVSIEDIIFAGNDLSNTIGKVNEGHRNAADNARDLSSAFQELSKEEQIAADASKLAETLLDEQGQALADLSAQYRSGEIDLATFNQGQAAVSEAADLSAKLVATLGEEALRAYPALGHAGEGAEGLASAIYDMMLQSSDSLPHIDELINRIVAIQVTAAATAETVRQNPILIPVGFTQLPFMGPINDAIRQQFPQGKGLRGNVAQDALKMAKAELDALLGTSQGPGLLTGLGSSTPFGTGPGAGSSPAAKDPSLIDLGEFLTSRDISTIVKQASAIRAAAGIAVSDDILNLIDDARFVGQISGIPQDIVRAVISDLTEDRREAQRVAEERERYRLREHDFIDVEELTDAQVQKIVRSARALQGKIGGETERNKDEIVDLIRNGQLVSTQFGLSAQLLRMAMEDLTEVERERLEEERRRAQANEILRNLQVQAGPLGALISQPTLFGVGGGIPAGLNIDPEKPNFNINVPIELKGLEPAKLQQIVYDTIYKAVRDGLTLQGTR